MTLKLALIGKGKTGGEVLKLALAQKMAVEVFDSTRRPDAKSLAASDVIISFVAGDVFVPMIPVLLEANRPVVSGATGSAMPDNLHQQIVERGQAWVWGSNFSLGMRIVHHMISELSRAPMLMPAGKFYLQETHHIHKKDSPSGTAISWRHWLGPDNAYAPIEAMREGDVVGDHSMVFETSLEKIELKHHAKSRALFAAGALWTAQEMMNKRPMPGLYLFEQFADARLKDLYART